ncbi:mucin-13b [Cheilinus undulatus]|uniref:mucin-13b n=1 Tax=Cheilinus undulatus TaxID=241271 RepID=UPI001BD20940|nr:mucin-13b [Cheilinus undulatus]
MAQVFKLLVVLWLFTACLGDLLATEGGGDTPTEKPTTAAPVDPPTEKPTTAAPVDPPTEKPTTAAPVDPPTEKPTTAAPVDPPTEKPTTAAPVDPPTEKPTTAAPVDPPTEKPTTAAPVDPPTEKPTTAAPVDPPTEKPTTAAPVDPPTEKPTTAAPVDPPTEKPTTAAPVDPPTEKPTTAAPVDPPTEKPTTGASVDPPTEKPTTAAPVDPPTEKPTTKPEPNPCESNPCGIGSTCVPRFDENFDCLCSPGYVYNGDRKTCEGAKVFPGELTLTQNYENEMEDPRSEIFLTLSQTIISELEKVFQETDGYTTSTVQKLLPTSNAIDGSRNERGVLAQVENIFEAGSKLETTEVTEAFKNGIEDLADDSVLKEAKLEAKNLCDTNSCDGDTTTCEASAGSFTCECKKGYIKTAYSDRVCIACPSGKKPEKDSCVNCPYGYSGFNCNESWKFVLTIVGSVLGGLLLISVIGMIVLASRPTKKKSKKNKEKDTGKGNVSNFSAKAPLVNGSSTNSQAASLNGTTSTFAGVPKIPRAMTSSGIDRRTNLEMTPSNSRQNLVSAGKNQQLYDDPDDINPYAQARSQTNPYAQARSQTNPYAQNRPQNPYSSNQGNTNFNYIHDNGRRLY